MVAGRPNPKPMMSTNVLMASSHWGSRRTRFFITAPNHTVDASSAFVGKPTVLCEMEGGVVGAPGSDMMIAGKKNTGT